MGDEIKIIDTTLRDGHQSLWALNMRTGWMLPALDHLDRAGYEAMEFFVPVVQIKKMIRDLNEDPFQWLRLGTQRAKQTPLRLHAGYRSGLGKVPESVSKLLVQMIIDQGITTARISEPWNDFETLKEEHDEMRRMGIESVVNIIYSVSPRHTTDYFVQRTRDAAALKPYRLCFKDVGGLLTPQRIRELLPKVLEAAGDVPVEFHNHCTNGLGTFNVQEAVALGIRHVHSAVPPLADGSSQPSVFAIVRNLRALGYDVPLDEDMARPASDYLMQIAEREGLAVGSPQAYDETLYAHQIPGGMISNLQYQLKKVGMGDRINLIREEAARVRAELGYPIMVTPLSQFVGTQAAINVITGDRYKQVSDETIQYALGLWGREALDHMDANVRDRILDRPRAKEIAAMETPQPSLAEVRKAFGNNLTDEELIIRSYIDEDAVRQVRQMPPPVEETVVKSPLLALVAGLAAQSAHQELSVTVGDMSVRLSRG
nr:oxaloacetate decarboxylase [uncultured bacterium]BAH89749.1 oxaloacetate decarboxylase [uncultured bacterium]BAH90575.1 oxaloacetate decarboxylase [uncultured bacterium]